MNCTIDKDTISKVTKTISMSLPNKKLNLVSRALFVFKHADSDRSRRYYIKNLLETFHVEQLGKCFLIIVTIDTAADVMEVVRHVFFDKVSLPLFSHVCLKNLKQKCIYFFFNIIISNTDFEYISNAIYFFKLNVTSFIYFCSKCSKFGFTLFDITSTS